MRTQPISIVVALTLLISASPPALAKASPGRLAKAQPTRLSIADYEDRAHAAWLGQILGAMMGFRFEHQVGAVTRVETLDPETKRAPVDDDWYYEMIALRAFERFGIDLTEAELGQQWKEGDVGTWGSSRVARLNLARGIVPPDTGHPRNNPLWWTIGPQFSADIYGLLAPGLPNVAGRLARTFGHINGFAEGTDGAVFVAGMISLAFVEKDVRVIVKQAAQLIDPGSPYRQCLDLVISMAESGKGPAEIAAAVEDRWHIEYPGTNNAVPNGGIVALSVWFGGGRFLDTVNLSYSAGDFTDADCNAANAGAVVGAMHGTRALPSALIATLNDRIADKEMGGLALSPVVDESIAALGKRTAKIGVEFLKANRIPVTMDGQMTLRREVPITQPLERFVLGDLMKGWNADWTLEHAGFGGGLGGLRGFRGMTRLEGDALVTWPRDEARGLFLRQKTHLTSTSALSVEVGALPGHAWLLEMYVDNDRVLSKLVEAPALVGANKTSEAQGKAVWQTVRQALGKFGGKEVVLRIFQRVVLPDRLTGEAHWRALSVSPVR